LANISSNFSFATQRFERVSQQQILAFGIDSNNGLPLPRDQIPGESQQMVDQA
jgi:hypothetical protein